jgi:hypothetical protein
VNNRVNALDFSGSVLEELLQLLDDLRAEPGSMTWIALVLVALWLLWPQYVKWKKRQKLREFEQEQRRKWEQHRRE